MLITPEGEFQGANPAAIALFGFNDEKEFMFSSPTALSPECQPDNEPSAAKAERMLATAMREGSHSFEWLHKRMDGTDFLTMVTLTKMDLDGGPLLSVTEATSRSNDARKRRSEPASGNYGCLSKTSTT